RARRLAAEFEAALAAADANAARAAQQALEALAQRSAQRLATTIEGLPAAHRSSAAAHLAAMDAALLAADPDAFDRAAAALDALATTLAADYTLRIVNRPGARSGVWRYPEGNRAARNYYIIVDAIGSDGAPVAIPVRNEETGQVTRAATFGIRVPQAVFERVRADKQDNGLVDQDQFGRKRPGVLEPEYAHEVAGGMITDWSD